MQGVERSGGGSDAILGGAGNDTVTFASNTTAVTASLLAGIAVSASGTDTFSGIENLIGTFSNDVLTGDGFDNIISGGNGDDILDGNAGNDQLRGDGGNDLIIGGTGLGNDALDGGSGTDTLTFASTTLGIIASLVAGTASGAEIGHRGMVDALIRLHEAGGAALGPDRALNLPSLRVTVAEMLASLARVGHGRRLGRVTIAPDPEITRICASWPSRIQSERARALGLTPEPDLDVIVRAYLADFAPPQ